MSAATPTETAHGVSGDRCREHVARLAAIHRIMGSIGYDEALDYARAALESLGAAGVRVETFPMDGERSYGDWIAPVAWQPRRAELWVESPERFPLADFGETPVSLHIGSQSTPPGGMRARLLDVGAGQSGDDYAAVAAGGVVLASGNLRDVYDIAVGRHGVRGIVTDAMPWQAPSIGRMPEALPDAVSYNKLPVRRSEIGNGVFSFGISARRGERLRRLLEAGPVGIHALVDAEAGEGELHVLTAVIPGSEVPQREIVLLAHLCHPSPGANDNATGPALVLELARLLVRRRPRLQHSIRVLLVPEMYGTVAWLLESEAPRGELALTVNLDMVGADRAKTRGQVWLDRSPWSAPSFFDDVLAAALDRVAQASGREWTYGVRDHHGGSDHTPFHAPEVAVPAVALGHFPDLYYHTNLDDLDKTAETEFERIGAAVLDALETFDLPPAQRARSVGSLVLARATERITTYAGRRLESDDCGDYRSDVGALVAKERATLASAGAEGGDELERVAAEQLTALRVRGTPVKRPTSAYADRILRKLLPGPLSTPLHGPSVFQDRLGQSAPEYRARSREDLGFVLWTTEVYNLADGRRTFGDIATIVAAEFDHASPSIEELDAFAGDLVATELAAWVD